MRRIHIFILFELAVFHPLFEQLRLSPDFFLANNNNSFDIIMLFLFVWLLIPFLLISVISLISRYSKKAGEYVHLAVFALLLLTTVLFALNRNTLLSPLLMVSLALIYTTGVTAGYRKYSSIRFFFTLLFPIIFVAPVLFFSNSFVQKLMSPEKTPSQSVKISNQTPVVLIILDELPLSSLLNEKEQIDSLRYPNFAEFVNESHWFRNTTTVAGYTTEAVPAILTGRYPKWGKFPVYFDHPQNIFVMLGNSHHIVALETATRLCPGRICESRISEFTVRFSSLLSNVAVLYAHLVLPPKWADRWFPIEDLVNFCKSAEDRAADFTEYVDQMEKPTGRPPFYFVHIQLPHYPWKYLPSGVVMNDRTLANLKKEISSHSPDRAERLFPLECHLLQVGYVDTLFGNFLNKLKEMNLYNSALIIVTSDHGIIRSVVYKRKVALMTNLPKGSAVPDLNSWENMLVPLFIKLPYQNTPVVSDRNVETIDVVPTIAHVLGIPINWTDGSSALNGSESERSNKYFYEKGKMMRMDPHLSVDRKMLANKLLLDSLPFDVESLSAGR